MNSSLNNGIHKLIVFFDNKLTVAISLGCILFIILVPYCIWASQQQPPEINWEQLVSEQPGTFLGINVDIAGLSKYYRPDMIADQEQLSQQYLSLHRESALEQRRITYQQISILACRVASNGVDLSIPAVLASLVQDERIISPVDEGAENINIRCGQVLPKPGDALERLLTTTPPHVILAWISKIKALVNNGCGICDGRISTEITNAENAVNGLIKSENILFNNAREYLKTLSHGPDFGFLYSEKYQWLIHLIVISWIGVITAAFAQLVVNINERRSTGLAFVLTLLRFITAPIIAIVFVATISYGLVDEPIALNHQPIFLIFAFATGYLSESFNLMLREGLNRLIPSFGINVERMQGAADLKAAAKRILSRPKQYRAQITTLPELESALRADINDTSAEIEAEIADKLTC